MAEELYDEWTPLAEACGKDVRAAVSQFIGLVVEREATMNKQAQIASVRVAMGLIGDGARLLLSLMPRSSAIQNADIAVRGAIEGAIQQKKDQRRG